MGKRRGKFSFEGQFAGRLVEMLETPAYRVLSRAALLTLSRLEIEYAAQGGTKGGLNGKLACTFEDLKKYGVHKDAIAAAIRELVALGFVQITQRGVAGNSDFRRPALYRLTFFPSKDDVATHDWRKITTIQDAERIARNARQATDPRAVARGKKQNPAPGFQPISTLVSGVDSNQVPTRVSGATTPTPVSGLLSRSRAGASNQDHAPKAARQRRRAIPMRADAPA